MLAAGLAGCGLLAGSGPTSSMPTQSVSTPATTGSAAVTPSVSVTPSVTPSAVPVVTAKGQLSFYKSNLVSKALAGTCAVVAGKPTVVLSDRHNDFFSTVDLTLVFAADGGDVASLAGKLGEDNELITRELVHPAKGTSAHLVASGGVYRISGNVMAYENGSKDGSLIPYSLTATCSRSDWLG